jgi:gluconate 2-dehydrogenase gamma chain
MAGQGIERRDVLRKLAYAAAAAQFPGFSRWVYGATEHVHAEQTSSTNVKAYVPSFLDATKYATLSRLCDLIIPPETGKEGAAGAGAIQAGVPEFIDFMLAHDSTIQYRFVWGLTWIEVRSAELYAKNFCGLSEEQQTKLLRPLAFSKEFQFGQEDGRTFFKLLREYTVIGFYTSRVGMEQFGAPGLEFYSESPGCPHVNDREHKHLPPPVN